MKTYNKAQKKKRRWRRVKQLKSDDDGSSDDKTPNKAVIAETDARSSERIRHKRMRTFRMPSRADVWKRILPCKSPGKYSHLKPRKLVNNFTKENNRYNYDPMYTSGSESMEDFLDDPELDSASDGSSSSCPDNKITEPSETVSDNSGDSGPGEGRHGAIRMRTVSNRLVSDSESGNEGGHVVKDCKRNRSLILDSDSEEEMITSEALAIETAEEPHKGSSEDCPAEHAEHNTDCLRGDVTSEKQVDEEKVLETMNEDVMENQSEHKESEGLNAPKGELNESDEDSDQPIRRWRKNSCKNMIVSDDEENQSDPEICAVAANAADVAPTDTSHALSLLEEHIESCFGESVQDNVSDEASAVNKSENCVSRNSDDPGCDCTKQKHEDSGIEKDSQTTKLQEDSCVDKDLQPFKQHDDSGTEKELHPTKPQQEDSGVEKDSQPTKQQEDSGTEKDLQPTKPQQEDSGFEKDSQPSNSREDEAGDNSVDPGKESKRCDTESSSDSVTSESDDDSEQDGSDGNKIVRRSRRFTPRIEHIRKKRAKDAVFEQFRKARRRMLRKENLGK